MHTRVRALTAGRSCTQAGEPTRKRAHGSAEGAARVRASHSLAPTAPRAASLCTGTRAHTGRRLGGDAHASHARTHARTTTIPRTTWSLASSSSSMASIIALEELDSIVHLATLRAALTASPSLPPLFPNPFLFSQGVPRFQQPQRRTVAEGPGWPSGSEQWLPVHGQSPAGPNETGGKAHPPKAKGGSSGARAAGGPDTPAALSRLVVSPPDSEGRLRVGVRVTGTSRLTAVAHWQPAAGSAAAECPSDSDLPPWHWQAQVKRGLEA